ncbi:glycerophosphodiester phosphodiesterase [Shewanella sp. GXUN23E]|uniref:glycerophosphodiester phosphodiesterase n=1 Tax=Shewanella sp. GXUN23E TaxID=3422498 RepID=UPI003D7DFC2E
MESRWTSRKMRRLLALSLSSMLLITGCQTAPKPAPVVWNTTPALAQLPANAMKYASTPERLASLEAEQLALASRNLFMTGAGTLSMIHVPAGLPQVVAHRGHYGWPENSPDAVSMALPGDFDGAEIDVMLTGDGYWVVHHDSKTGRAVSRPDGKRFDMDDINGKEWNSLRIRDKSGQLTSYPAPYAFDVFRQWARYNGSGKPLNIELKSEAGNAELYHLDRMARETLGQGNFFYSAMKIDTLQQLRALNPQVYLGYVWEADGESIEIAKREYRKAVQSDAAYGEYQDWVNFAGRYETRRRHRNGSNKLSAAEVKNKLGSHSGLHVDIRNLVRSPSIAQRVQSAGLKRLASYSINGTDYHQSQLALLKRQGRALPDEVIADTDKYHLYSRMQPELVYPPALALSREQVLGQSLSIPQMIGFLPSDADFSRLDEQSDYVSNGFYLTLAGKVRALFAHQPDPGIGSKEADDGPKVIQDDASLEVMGKAVEISLPVGGRQ